MNTLVKRTQIAFIGIRLLGTPCWCILGMLIFILYKYLHVTPFQIAILIALKPTSALLSPYWSHAIYQRPDKIIPNLMGANILRHLPFLFTPWVHSAWFLIFAFGFYMMLSRATIPAWLEMFKFNLPKEKREQLIGYGTTVDYLGTALLAIGMGILLDRYPEMWRWLISGTAAIGIVSTVLLPLIASQQAVASLPLTLSGFKLKEKIITPWKQVWTLLKGRKDFALFQIGFMLGGGGLMIMHPALPKLFIDKLHLSFVEMGVAISLCKGMGVALSSSFWTWLFRHLHIFHLSALVTLFATLFPFLLLATSLHLSLLYCAFIFYGVMQGGSELSWHMSALVFAKEKESSLFSITNVLTVGIRGCFIPTLGALLLPFCQPIGVILIGALLCLSASLFFLFSYRYLALPNSG